MFSKYFNPKALLDLLEIEPPSVEEVDSILQTESFNIRDLAKLVLISDDEILRFKIITEAVNRRSKAWKEQLFLVPPLYISDGDLKKGCLDNCAYCPWRQGNVPVEKLKRLSEKEISIETKHLIKLGYSDIELVAATDSKLFKIDNATKAVIATKNAGAGNIGINFFPLKSVGYYQTLANAGCTFVIVWQETYIPETYKRMHQHGPKASMQYRLDAHDRALKGGIKTAGVAFLGGLADWKFDMLATINHALYLRKEYEANIIFGMPRWKNSFGIPMHVAPTFYGDREYELVGALYSLAIPEALPWFSTREPFELSTRCSKGGGCMFTLDCSTEVGGYTNKDGFSQFPVYSYPLSKGVSRLKDLGFNPKIHLPW